MTGDFWYYDKLDFDLKFSNAHVPFTSPIHTLLAGFGRVGGWGGLLAWALRGKAAGSSPGPSHLLSFTRLQSCGSFAGDWHNISTKEAKREDTLVPSSYLSRAHSKTEDSGFPSKNFPDSKSGLSFIHGAIKTYIYKCICRQWYLISYLKFFEAQIVILRGGSHHSTETFRRSLKFSAIQMCMFFHLWGAW